MKHDLLDLASSFTRRGVSFVMATVVRRDGATPAHVGDMALVTGDGTFHGWLGTPAMRAVIEREAVRALGERRPCLLCLSSAPDRHSRPGVLPLPLPDGGEGTVEVYLAPVITAPRLILFGRSPVLSALAALARAIGYRVDLVDAELRDDELHVADHGFQRADDPRLLEGDGVPVMAVVAPGGDHDVEHLAAALAMAPVYLGVIASRRRFTLLRDALTSRGLGSAVDRIAHPAGLALGAHDPGEVAVGILAQMIARRNDVAAVNEASVTLSESSEVTSTMDIVVESEAAAAPTSPTPASPAASANFAPGNVAATASCFPTPVRDEGTGATMALRVRASSPSLEKRVPAGAPGEAAEDRLADLPEAAATAPSDGTPMPMGLGLGEAIDPVCQASVVIAGARHLGRWEDRTWYFCCAACKAKFLANPLRYSAFTPPA